MEKISTLLFYIVQITTRKKLDLRTSGNSQIC